MPHRALVPVPRLTQHPSPALCVRAGPWRRGPLLPSVGARRQRNAHPPQGPGHFCPCGGGTALCPLPTASTTVPSRSPRQASRRATPLSFTDKEAEAQRRPVTRQGHTAGLQGGTPVKVGTPALSTLLGVPLGSNPGCAPHGPETGDSSPNLIVSWL